MADEISVMYAGRIVEKGSADTIFNAPEHPYTWGLLGSIPRMDAARRAAGRRSGVRRRRSSTCPGCSFHPRCPYVRTLRRVGPTLEPVAGDPTH